MPESSRFGHLPWLLLSVLILVVDRVTKDIFEGTLSMYQRIEVIPGYFDWTLAYNTGAAFSFLADAGGWQRWFFVGLGVVAVAYLGFLMTRHAHQTGFALDSVGHSTPAGVRSSVSSSAARTGPPNVSTFGSTSKAVGSALADNPARRSPRSAMQPKSPSGTSAEDQCVRITPVTDLTLSNHRAAVVRFR